MIPAIDDVIWETHNTCGDSNGSLLFLDYSSIDTALTWLSSGIQNLITMVLTSGVHVVEIGIMDGEPGIYLYFEIVTVRSGRLDIPYSNSE